MEVAWFHLAIPNLQPERFDKVTTQEPPPKVFSQQVMTNCWFLPQRFHPWFHPCGGRNGPSRSLLGLRLCGVPTARRAREGEAATDGASSVHRCFWARFRPLRRSDVPTFWKVREKRTSLPSHTQGLPRKRHTSYIIYTYLFYRA